MSAFIDIVEIQIALINTFAHFNNTASSLIWKNLNLEVHMEIRVLYGDESLTLDTISRQVILYNGCPTVGQGEGNSKAEILRSSLTDLYPKLDERNDGLFKYSLSLKHAFLALAKDMCNQVGIEPIVFVEDNEE